LCADSLPFNFYAVKNEINGMVTACFLAFLLAWSGPPLFGADNDESEFTSLEGVWNEAHLHGDFDALNRLWDEQIVVVVPKMKLINKSDGLDMFRTSRMKFLRYETSELSIRRYRDTVLVTGHLLRTRKMNDRELQDDWRFTKVYVQHDGQWRVILWQASDWPG
jgi:ketosteroid isomerase-like protein